jgi:hypothetical protein
MIKSTRSDTGYQRGESLGVEVGISDFYLRTPSFTPSELHRFDSAIGKQPTETLFGQMSMIRRTLKFLKLLVVEERPCSRDVSEPQLLPFKTPQTQCHHGK